MKRRQPPCGETCTRTRTRTRTLDKKPGRRMRMRSSSNVPGLGWPLWMHGAKSLWLPLILGFCSGLLACLFGDLVCLLTCVLLFIFFQSSLWKKDLFGHPCLQAQERLPHVKCSAGNPEWFRQRMVIPIAEESAVSPNFLIRHDWWRPGVNRPKLLSHWTRPWTLETCHRFSSTLPLTTAIHQQL